MKKIKIRKTKRPRLKKFYEKWYYYKSGRMRKKTSVEPSAYGFTQAMQENISELLNFHAHELGTVRRRLNDLEKNMNEIIDKLT